MTTFIKAKLKKSDDQTKIDKYCVAAKYNRISYYIKIDPPKNHHFKIHDDKSFILSKMSKINMFEIIDLLSFLYST